jgi:hypothetical protein
MINNKPISSAVTVLMHVSEARLVGTLSAKSEIEGMYVRNKMNSAFKHLSCYL